MNPHSALGNDVPEPKFVMNTSLIFHRIDHKSAFE